MAENKYTFFSRFRDSDRKTERLLDSYQRAYERKYYNLWMSKFDWSGLDEENKEQEENYIMRKLWIDGKVAMRNIKETNMIALCPFTEETFNYLDFPETVVLINKRGAAEQIIPPNPQIVNKEVAIIYCTPGHDSIKSIVDSYIEKMVQVDLIINNNLLLQNMPFMVACDESDKKKMKDIITRILNGEIAIFSEVDDIKKLQALVTQTPYLIDKLKSYQVSLENELLTVLGVDNSGVQAKRAQMLVDEVNANNDIINDYGMSIEDELTNWIERANKVLNRNIKIKSKSIAIDSTHAYEDASVTQVKERLE